MGNTQSNADGVASEVIHISSRPLPHVPDESDGEYDLDSPPPYPPPLPPIEDGTSRRLSWKLIDANVFKNRKSGTWTVPGDHQYDSVSPKSPPETNLSDTLASDNTNIVTVRYLDNDGNSNLKTTNLGQNKLWGTRNMQLVLNTELNSQGGGHHQVNGTHSRNGFGGNPCSMNGTNSYETNDVYLIPTKNIGDSLVYHSTPKQGSNTNLPKLNTIRLDYPEGTVRTVTNYNEFDISKYSADANSLGSAGTSSMSDDGEHKSNISSVSIESLQSPKKRSFNFGPCFGESKPKKARLQIDKDTTTSSLNTSSKEYSPQKANDKNNSSSKLKPQKHTSKNGVDLSSRSKMQKKPDFTSCFGKSKHDMGSNTSLNIPTATGKNNIEFDTIELNTADINNTNAGITVEENSNGAKNMTDTSNCSNTLTRGENDLEMNINLPKMDVDVSLESPKKDIPKVKKFDLGACFGKGKVTNIRSNGSIESPDVSLDGNKDIPNDSCKVIIPIINGDDENQICQLEATSSTSIPKLEMNLEGTCSKDLNLKFPKSYDSLDIKSTPDEITTDASIFSDNKNVSPEFDIEKLECDISTHNMESARINAGTISHEFDLPIIARANASAPEIDNDVPNVCYDRKFEKDPGKVTLNISNKNVQNPTFQSRKQKVSDLSCFGKSKTKVNTYQPSVKINVEGTDPEVEINTEMPNISAQSEIKPPKVKSKAKKPRASLTTCFGKSPNSQIELSGGRAINKDEASLGQDSHLPEERIEVESALPKVEIKSSKNSNKKVPLGSCFGQKNSGSIIAKESEVKSEGSFTTPEVKAKGSTLKTKTVESKLGACFGKSQKSKVNVERSIETDLDVNADIPITDSKIHLEPSPLKVDAELPKLKKKNLELTSCFGKSKKTDEKLNRSTEIPSASLEGNADIPSISADIAVSDVEVKQDILEVNIPTTNTPNVAIGFEGNSASDTEVGINGSIDMSTLQLEGPAIDVGHIKISPEKDISAELDFAQSPQNGDPVTFDAQINSPNLGPPALDASMESSTVSAHKFGIDIPDPSASADVVVAVPATTVSQPIIKTKKPKLSGLSCLGKSKANTEVYEPSANINVENIAPEIDIKTEMPDMKTEGEIQKPKVKSKTIKPRARLTSCFGKGSKSEIEVSTGEPIHQGEASLDLDSNVHGARIEIEPVLPQVEIKSTKKSNNKALLGSCLGQKKSGSRKSKGSLPEIEVEGSEKTPLEVIPKIPTLKTKGPKLGACFGKTKKPKLEVEGSGEVILEVNADTPKSDSKLSMESSAFKVDPKMPKLKRKKNLSLGSCFGKDKTTDGKLIGSIEVPSVSMEDNTDIQIPSISADICVPDVKVEPSVLEVTMPTIDTPKVAVNIEGDSSTDMEVGIDGSIDIPKLEIEGPNINVGDAKMPAEMSDSGDFNLVRPAQIEEPVTIDAQIESPIIELPTFDASMECPTVSAPEIDMVIHDIPVDLPDPSASGEVIVAIPDATLGQPTLKTKKDKVSGLSCFGKSKTTKEAYEPSANLKVGVIDPEIKTEIPDIKAEGEIQGLEVKSKAKKPKARLASCFGKGSKPEVEVSAEKSIQPGEASIELASGMPETTIDIKPTLPQVEIKAPKKSSNKALLGSCFGQKKSGSIKAKGPLPDIEADISQRTLEVKSEGPTLKAKTGGAKLGVCFGKTRKSKLEVETSGEGVIDINTDIPNPDSKISTESSTIKVDADIPKLQKKKKLELGSCFGKIKAPDGKFNSTIEAPPASVEGDANIPSISAGIDVPDIIVASDISEVKMTSIDTPKVIIGGEGNIVQDMESGIERSIDIPIVELEGADIDLGDIKISPELEASANVNGAQFVQNIEPLNIDAEVKSPLIELPTYDPSNECPIVSAPKIDIDIPDPSASGEVIVAVPDKSVGQPLLKPKKAKVAGLSCFGKSKTKKESYHPSAELNIEGINPTMDIKTENPEFSAEGVIRAPEVKSKAKKRGASLASCFGKGSASKIKVPAGKPIHHGETTIDLDPSMPEARIEVEPALPQVEIKSSKKSNNKASLGSCFGQKNSGSINPDGPLPEIEIGGSVKTSSEVKAEGPRLRAKKGGQQLGACFGKTKKSKIEVDPSGTVDLDVVTVMPKSDNQMSVEPLTLKLDTEVPKGKKKKNIRLGSCFGKNKTPDETLKSTIEVPSTSIEGSANIPSFSDDIYTPNLKVEQDISEFKMPITHTPKVTIGLEGNCAPDAEVCINESIDIPKIELKGPDIDVGEIKVSPDMDGSVYLDYDKSGQNVEPVNIDAEIKSPIIEIPTSGVSVEYPTVSAHTIDINAPDPSVSGEVIVAVPDTSAGEPILKSKKAKVGGLSCFGMSKTKKKPYEPSAKVNLEGADPTIVSKGELPDIRAEGEIQAPEVKCKSKRSRATLASCFGKSSKSEVDVSAGKSIHQVEGHIELDSDVPEPSIEIQPRLPQVEIKSSKKSNNKPSLGSCFSKKKSGSMEAKVSLPDIKPEGNVKTSEVIAEGPRLKAKTGGSKLSDCFGKTKHSKVQLEASDTTELDVNAELPKPDSNISVEPLTLKLDAEVPKLKKKKNLGLGSCFGKSKAADRKLKNGIEVHSTSLEGNANIPSIGADVVPTVEVKQDIFEVPMPTIDTPKVTVGLEGNSAPDVEIEIDRSMNVPKVELGGLDIDVGDVKILPEMDVSADLNFDQSLQNVEPVNIDAEMMSAPIIELPTFEAPVEYPTDPSPKIDIDVPGPSASVDTIAVVPEMSVNQPILKLKKPKGSGLSCFGKSRANKEPYEPSSQINVKSAGPEVEIKTKLPEIRPGSDIHTPEVISKGKKQRIKLATCFGKDPKSEIEVSVGKSVHQGDSTIDLDSDMPETRIEIQQALPKGETKSPKTSSHKASLVSCFGRKKSSGIMKDKEQLPEIEAGRPVNTPEGKSEGPILKANTGGSKLGECFGKTKKSKVQVKSSGIADLDVNADIPSSESNISVEPLTLKVDTDVPKLKNKKNLGLRSCFAKSKKPDGKFESSIKVPSASLEGSANIPSISTDITVPNVQVEQDILEGETPRMEGPNVTASLEGNSTPDLGVGIDGSFDIPKVQLEGPGIDVSDTKISPEMDGSVNLKFEQSLQNEGNVNIDAEAKSPPIIELPIFEASVECPTVSAPKIDIDTPGPSASVDAIVVDPETSVRKPILKLNKPKGSGLSCFGKSKIKKEPYEPSAQINVKCVDPKLEIKTELPDVRAEGDIKVPEVASKRKKPRANLTACFGKDPKPEIVVSADKYIQQGDMSIGTDSSLPEVGIEIEPKLPEVEAKATKKTKNKVQLGSCFRQKQSGSVEAKGSLPEIETDGYSKTPVVIEEPPRLKVKSQGHKLGACFGKAPKAKVQVDASSTADIDINAEIPKYESEISGEPTSLKYEAEVSKLKKKNHLRLGSCFGKSKTQDGKLKSGIEVQSASLEGDSNIPSISADIRVPNPDVEQHILEVNMPPTHSSKVTIGVEENCAPDMEVGIDGLVDIPKVKLEGPDVDVLDIKGLPEMSGSTDLSFDQSRLNLKTVNIDAEIKSPIIELPKFDATMECPTVSAPKIDIDVPNVSATGEDIVVAPDNTVKQPILKTKKAKVSGLSCFGKSKAKTDVESIDPNLEIKGELYDHKAEGKIQAPEVKSKAKKPRTVLASCFGKDLNPKIEVSSGKSTNQSEASIELESDTPEAKIEIEPALPQVEMKSPERSNNKVSLGSCFGKKKSGIIKAEGSLPEIEAGGTANTSEVRVEGPRLKAKTGGPKIAGCFGNMKKSKIRVEPSDTADLDLTDDIPKPGGKLSLEPPTLEMESEVPKVQKRKNLGLGSCFGKSKTPNRKRKSSIEVPSASMEGNANIPFISTDISVPNAEIEQDILEVIMPCIDTPNVTVGMEGNITPDVEIGVDGSIDIPKVQLEGPDLDMGDIKASPETLALNYDQSLQNVDAVNIDTEIKPPIIELPTFESSVECPTGSPPTIGSVMPDQSASGEVIVAVPDTSVSRPMLGAKKTKRSGVSCFGKSKSEEEPYDPSTKINVEGVDPEIKIKTDVPKISLGGKIKSHEVKSTANVPRPSLASCFGKGQKTDIEISAGKSIPEVEAGIHMDPHLPEVRSEVEQTLPEVEIKSSKKSTNKASLRSCFGHKSSDIKAKGSLPEIEAAASLNIPEVKAEESRMKAKTRGPNLAACFGKTPKSKLQVEPSGAARLDVNPDVSNYDSQISVEPSTLKVDADIPKLKKNKNLGIGSCFGKSKVPDRKIKSIIEVPPVSLETDENRPSISTGIVTHNVEVEADILNVKLPIIGTPKIAMDLEGKSTPDIKANTGGAMDIPKLELEVSDINASDIKISPDTDGSTDFTSDRSVQNIDPSNIDVELNSQIKELPAVDANIESSTVAAPTIDIEIPDMSPDMHDPTCSGEVSICVLDTTVNRPKLKTKNAKEGGLSCFGKSKSKKHGNEPSAKVDLADTTQDVEIITVIPSTKVVGEIEAIEPKSKKRSAKLGSCFGKSPKSEMDVSAGKYIPQDKEGIDVVSPFPEVGINVEPVLPEVAVKPLKKSSVNNTASLSSCFGKKKSRIAVTGSLPEIEAEGSLKTAEIEVEDPRLKTEKGDPKLTPGFGKTKKLKASVEGSGEADLDIDVDIPESHKITVEPSGLQVGAEIPNVKKKKKNLGLGSCFGKSKSPDGKLSSSIEIPSASVEGNLAVSPISPDIAVPDVEVEQDILEVKVPTIDTPKVTLGLEGSSALDMNVGIDGSFDIPKVTMEETDVRLADSNLEYDGDVKSASFIPTISYTQNVLSDDDLLLVNGDTESNLHSGIKDIDICHSNDNEATIAYNVDYRGDNHIENNECNETCPIPGDIKTDGDISMHSNINLPDVIEANIPRLIPSQLDIGDRGVFDTKDGQECICDVEYNSTESSSSGMVSVTERTKYFSVPSISDSISEDIAETIHNFQHLKDALIEEKDSSEDLRQTTAPPEPPARWYRIDGQQSSSDSSNECEISVPSGGLNIEDIHSSVDSNTVISSHSSKEIPIQTDGDTPSTLISTSPFVSSLSEEILKEFIKDNDTEISKVVHQMGSTDSTDASSNYFTLDISTSTDSSAAATSTQEKGSEQTVAETLRIPES